MAGEIWTICAVTLREGYRRRLLPALAALSLVAVLLTAWGYGQLPHLAPGGESLTPVQIEAVASLLLIVVMFMFSFVLALAAVFAAAPSIAGELESGEALAVVARPIRRSSILIGKWLALAIVVTAYAILVTGAEFVAVFVPTGYVPPHPVEAALYLDAVGLVTLTLATALSTRIPPVTTGIVAMLLFGLAWLGGVVGGIGSAFEDPVTTQIGAISRILLPSDGLWRGALFSLEPPGMLVAGAMGGPQFAAFPFYAPAPPPVLYLAWCAVWLAGMIVLAVVSFDRRDL